MLNQLKRIILFSILSLLIFSPTAGLAWHDYVNYGDWDYHGSGRDHPYSEYIGRYYNPGYNDFPVVKLAIVDDASYVKPAPAPAVPQPDEFTVNIPNEHGGYNAVVIKKSGDGFVGPQGEYYPEFPKTFQLQMKYSK